MRLRLVASVFVLAACTSLVDCQSPTELTVVVSTDVPCARIKDVFFVAGAPESVEGRDPASVLAPVTCGPDGRLGSVVVVPSGDKNAQVGLRVVAGLDGVSAKSCTEGGSCILARRTLRYVPRTPLNVPIRLEASCAGRVCDLGTTCQAGNCVSSTITCNGDACDLPVPPPVRAGTWAAAPTLSAPRTRHVAGWTGKELWIWGGAGANGVAWDGERLGASFSAIPAPKLQPREASSTVFAGGALLFASGIGSAVDGARFDGTSWNAIADVTQTPGLANFYGGEDAIGGVGTHGDSIWVDANGTAVVHTGANAPAPRAEGSGFVAYGRLYVWGGRDATSALGDGAVYDPVTDSWTALSTAGAPSARFAATMTWNGTQAYLYGGQTVDGTALATGAIFTP